MILFVSFAPIRFYGGAEKWIVDVAHEISKKEEIYIIDMNTNIASLYSRLVLKRNYDLRFHDKLPKNVHHISLNMLHFFPFGLQFNLVINLFKRSRCVYLRYELNEILIAVYFGGVSVFKKLVIGTHTVLRYSLTRNIFEKLHNFIYMSRVSKFLLLSAFKIHTIHQREYRFLTNEWKLKNVVRVPNFVQNLSQATRVSSRGLLKVVFVGELNERKGTDILIRLLKRLPEDISFTIVGDGEMKEELIQVVKLKGCKYFGHLSHNFVYKKLRESDVFFQPSRAESMSIAALEALSCSLILVNSNEASLELGKPVEYSSNVEDVDEFQNRLQKLLVIKRTKSLHQLRNLAYGIYKTMFSRSIVMRRLLNSVFDIAI